ncbi:phenylacetyl ligase [Fusarium sp. NRRL 52700]|nr:phenylacetyl ligase [Fusarium sp. NRRL 52700]
MIYQSQNPKISFSPKQTLWSWLLESKPLSSDSNVPGFTDAITKEHITFQCLKEYATTLSSALVINYRLRQNDTVVVFAKNSIWYPVATLAAVRVGAVACGVSPEYTVDELYYSLKTSKAKVIFATVDNFDIASIAAKKAGITPKNVLLLESSRQGVMSIQDIIASSKTPVEAPAFRITDRKSNRDTCAFLCFSSGTTGLPKAVMISHANIIAQCIQTADITLPNHNRVLAALPFHHISGIVHQLHLPIHRNANVYVLPKFTLDSLLKTASEYKIRELVVVPPILIRLVREPELVSKYDLSHVERFSSGAAPLSREILTLLERTFPGTGFKQGYGMTESCSVITSHPPSKYAYKYADRVGMLVGSTEVRIVDIETGEDCEVGKAGEVWARGPQIAMGYLDNPEATESTFDKDGFLHTGDIGYFDHDGMLAITDRLKEIIKVKGIGVAPAELEGLLLGHPHVYDVAVCGVPDERAGERPKAFVVLKSSEMLRQVEAAIEIFDYVQKEKARHKWLKEIELVSTIPKSPADDETVEHTKHLDLLYSLLENRSPEEILPKLRNLDIDKTQCTKFSLCDPEPILLLRGAPRLQTLKFRGPGERPALQNSDSSIQEFCAGVTNITELQIQGVGPFFTGDWQTRAFERILGAAQNLETSEFVVVGDDLLRNSLSLVPATPFFEFLNLQTKKTLQHLSLNFDTVRGDVTPNRPITPELIKQFSSLNTLELDPSCYCSHRVRDDVDISQFVSPDINSQPRGEIANILEQQTYLVDFLPQAVQTFTIFLDKLELYGFAYDTTLLAKRVVSGEFLNLVQVRVDAPIWSMRLRSNDYEKNAAHVKLSKMEARGKAFREAFDGSGVEKRFKTLHVWQDGLVCLAIGTGLVIYNVTLGFGKDQSQVDPAVVPTIALTGTIFGIFGVLSASWSKTSFALTLIRLVDGWTSWFLWFLIISTNIIMDLVIVFSFVKCTPAKKVWHSSLPGTCWNPMVATYYNIFAGAFSGLVDLILCVIAWTIIWKLSMRTREKIGVGIALTFGVFAAAAAAAKCYKMLGLSSKNRTLDRVGIIIWSTTECAVTIMAASIPVMRILILRVYRRTPDQISNRPLRTLRIISTRDKRESTNNTMPSYNTEGTNMLAEDGLRGLDLPSQIVSARRNDIALLDINRKS